MAGPYGERPQACYYVYTAAQVVGFVVRTLYIVLQDDTSSEESETLDMAEVLSDLPAEWSDEVKMQAIEGNYGKRFDMMHYWADEGDIPKLTLFAAFLERTYKTPADFEKLKPGLMTAGRVAQEKIYKFCLPLTVRPQTSRAGCTVPRRAPSAAARYPARYPCTAHYARRRLAWRAQLLVVLALLDFGDQTPGTGGSHRYREWLLALNAVRLAAGAAALVEGWVVDADYLGRTIQLFWKRVNQHLNKPQLTYTILWHCRRYLKTHPGAFALPECLRYVRRRPLPRPPAHTAVAMRRPVQLRARRGQQDQDARAPVRPDRRPSDERVRVLGNVRPHRPLPSASVCPALPPDAGGCPPRPLAASSAERAGWS